MRLHPNVPGSLTQHSQQKQTSLHEAANIYYCIAFYPFTVFLKQKEEQTSKFKIII